MRASIRVARIVVLLGLAACQLPYTGGARPVRPSEIDPTWLHASSTPVVRQRQQTDCGLAALAMVAGAWGRHWSVDDLSHRVRPTSKGVKLGALRDVARERGLQAFTIKATYDDLKHELAAGRPVLMGLMLPYDHTHNLSHFEVAVAMDPKSSTVITIDPASGKWMRRTKAVLDIEWKAAGYPALVVVGERVIASDQCPSCSTTTRPSSSASISPMH